MADEILYAGLGDLTLAETLSAAIVLLLADRVALPNHEALIYAGDLADTGSKVTKIRELGLMGYDGAAATSEGTAVANTALTDGSVQLTIARYSKRYERGDIARLVDADGLLSPEMFAQDAVVTSALHLTDLLANLVDNFSTTTGASGVDATPENFLDACTALEIAKVMPPYMAVLHPVQWGDIRKDLLLASGGAIQWSAAAQEAQRIRGTGYQGQLGGVDLFTTTRVPTANAGADRAGGIFGRGALAWADATPKTDLPAPWQQVFGNKVLFELQRTASSGLTAFVMHIFLAASEVLDACGVSIITDA